MRLTGRYNPEITIYLGQRCGHEAYRSVFTGMTLALTSSRIILTRLLEKQRYVNEIVALLSLTLSIYNFYTWLIVTFCLLVNAMYEWNVTETNSCDKLNIIG